MTTPEQERERVELERQLGERHDPARTDTGAFVEPERQPVPEDVMPPPETSEPAEAEPMEAEPVETEPVETEPVEAEPVEAEPVEAESAEPEPAEPEPLETETLETETLESEPVESEPIAEEARPVDDVQPDDVISPEPVTVLDDYADDTTSDTVPETVAQTGLWAEGALDDLRERWDAIQMRFVDDPPGVAADARALVSDAVAALRDSLDRVEEQLGEPVEASEGDTEQMRQRVWNYRRLLDSLVSR